MSNITDSLLNHTCQNLITTGINQAINAVVTPQVRSLTDEIILNATPQPDKEITLTDHTCPGAIVRIRNNSKSGIITRTFAYRFRHPKTSKYTKSKLGQYPEMSLAKARIIWAELDRKNRMGTLFSDSHVTKLCHHNKSFREAFEAWMHSSVMGSTKYIKTTRAMFENHVLPSLGDFPVASITVPMIIHALEPLEKEKKLETIRRIIGRLIDIFDRQVISGIIRDHNISAAFKHYKIPKKESFKAVSERELPSVLNVITTASIDVQTRCLMLFQLHTIVRPVEAARAKWCDIDLERGLWTFFNKKGVSQPDKNGIVEPHKVPLSTQALEILGFMDQLQNSLEKSQYVFPNLGSSVDTHMSSQTCNNVLKKNGFKDQQHAHGFRSNASTIMNELGMDYDLIEKSLSHVEKSEVRRTYNRADYIEKRRGLHQWWSNFVEANFKGNYPSLSL